MMWYFREEVSFWYWLLGGYWGFMLVMVGGVIEEWMGKGNSKWRFLKYLMVKGWLNIEELFNWKVELSKGLGIFDIFNDEGVMGKFISEGGSGEDEVKYIR